MQYLTYSFGKYLEDAEKKSKPKKAKNSPSLTSAGAYMLVYTLDKYIKSPEPDPELRPYLIDLVKREDVSFEEEVNKNKNEKVRFPVFRILYINALC